MSWKQRVLDNFDAAAPFYDAVADVQRRAAARLAEMLPDLLPDADVLEIGCGTGAFTKRLVKHYPAARLHVSDFAPDMLKAAQGNVSAPHVTWSVLDGENLESDRRYDLIVSNMSFQWFLDIDTVLKNMRSFLNPGGQILFSMPGADSFKEWRAVLDSLDLPVGLLNFDMPFAPRLQDQYAVPYESGMDFLRAVKTMGAQRARDDYTPLGAGQVRRACALLDKRYGARVTWDIAYYRLPL